jgi:hypothetical protein
MQGCNNCVPLGHSPKVVDLLIHKQFFASFALVAIADAFSLKKQQ